MILSAPCVVGAEVTGAPAEVASPQELLGEKNGMMCCRSLR